MIGMGDVDQGGGPFAKASSEQLGDAPLGHDRPDMGARCHDAGPGSQRGVILREGSARRGRR